MSDHPDPGDLSRRKVVLAGLGAAATAVLAACGRNRSGGGTTAAATQEASTTTAAAGPTTTAVRSASPPTATLAPTPACADDDDITPAQTEGPYFRPNSPERTNIRGSAPGTKLLLTGTVVTTDCKPV